MHNSDASVEPLDLTALQHLHVPGFPLQPLTQFLKGIPQLQNQSNSSFKSVIEKFFSEIYLVNQHLRKS